MAGSSFFVDVVLRPRRAEREIYNIDRSLRTLDATAGRVAKSLDKLFKVGFGAVVVAELLSTIDAYTTIGNRIKVVTESTEEFVAVQDQVYEVANRSRVPVEAVATTYARLRAATIEMGLSQEQVLRMTETLAKGLLIYGSSQAEATSTMRQFSQALSKGKLNGDEFVSVMENSPPIVKLLTKELKVTKGELFALAKAGKIGARVLVDALANGADEIDRQFAKMTPTIGQALTVLRNQYTRFVGELATTSGVAKGLADAILFIAANFDVFTKIALAASHALGVVFAVRAINAAVQGLRLLGSAILANPFTALIAGIILLISLMYQFDVGISSIGTGTIRFQRLVEVAWDKIKTAIVSAMKVVGSVVVDTFDYFYEGFKELEIGFGDVLVFVGIFVDKFIALITFLKDTVVFLVAGIAAALVFVLAKGVGEALSLLEKGINKAISAYNSLASRISGKLTLGKVDLGGDFLLQVADAADKTGEHFAQKAIDSFKALTSTDLGPVATAIKDLLSEAAEGGDKAKKSLFDLSQVGDDVFTDIPEKAKKTKDGFDKLVESLYPAVKAMNDLRDAKREVDKELAKGDGSPLLSSTEAQASVRVLTKLMKQGKVSATEYATALQEIADRTKRRASSRITDEQGNQLLDRQRYLLLETADPLGHYNYLVGQAADKSLLLATVQDQLPEQFQAEIKAREKLAELVEKGIVLSEFELRAREARGVDTTADRQLIDQQLEVIRIAATVDAQAEKNSQDAIDRNKRLEERIKNSRAPQEEYVEQLQEIADQYAATGGAAFKFEEAVAELDKKFGFTREPAEDKDAEKWRQMNEDLQGMLEITQVVSSAFSALEEQIVSFVMTGEASFKAMVDSMLESLTRLILKIIETRLLMALLGNPNPTIVGGPGGGLIGDGLLQPAGFHNGGAFMVRGRGGVDNNLAMLRLSNNEDVRIRTPEQRRRDERNEGGGAPPQIQLVNVNSVDPGQMVPIIGSRPGQRQVYNTMRFAPRVVGRMR